MLPNKWLKLPREIYALQYRHSARCVFLCYTHRIPLPTNTYCAADRYVSSYNAHHI